MLKLKNWRKIMSKSVLLAIINNREVLPLFFVKSLMELKTYTELHGVNVDLRFFNAVDINLMRNMASEFALKGKYDYMMQLDTDMVYPEDSIIKLIKRRKDVVIGTARRRTFPFKYVHCKSLKKDYTHDSNIINPIGKRLIKVEVTGVPGALIKTKVLKKIKYPYFLIKYYKNRVVGGDIYFCKQLKKKGIKIFIDPLVNYSHKIDALISKNGMEMI